MSKPRPEEFRKFIELLLDAGEDGFEPWLFRCEPGSKAPAVEFGSWKDESNRLTVEEAVAALEDGYNIGIAGMEHDRLVNVDIDDVQETDPESMKPTLAAKSRSREGFHFYYFGDGDTRIPNIPTDEKGEIRAQGQYVLAPGSYVQTDPDAVPPEEQADAGYYTVENAREPARITIDELPEIFRLKLQQAKEETDGAPDEDYEIPDGDGNSALYQVSAEDVAVREGASTDPSERWESAFHGSTTGQNMSLSSKGRIQCWRHNVAHGGLQALAALSDYPYSCEQIGTGHTGSNAGPSCIKGDDSAIWHAWKYAKKNGYIPDDDPIPYRALKHLCRERGLCAVTEIPEQYDPESGATIPDYAYDAAISSVRNKDGVDPGRKKTTAIDDSGDQSDGNAAVEAEAEPAPDGGAAAVDSGGEPVYDSIEDQVHERITVPLNSQKYGEPEDAQITYDEAVDRFASILCDTYHFVRPREDTRGWRDTLYVYEEDSGIYEPFGEYFVETEAERLLGDFATNQRVREIVGKVERRSRVRGDKLRTDEERLVVGNGILDLKEAELYPHTPTEYHQTSLPVHYNPDAACPRIDSFLHDIVDDSDVRTLYRLIAHCLFKEYVAEKAAMLLGEGRNGKSVFLSLVEEFLGQYNVSNQSLQKLNEDDWSAQNLVGKLANIHPDMSDQTIQTMQMFKKLTGRDSIDADVKFENPIKFENYATLLFACNRMPVLKDDTRGNWRRWILITFPNTFERGDEDYKEKRHLMAELTTEDELSGLMNRCLGEIQAWYEGRQWFPSAPDWKQTRKKIRRAAEPVYDFAHACLREAPDDDDYIPTDVARKAYRQYASEEGLPPIAKEDFGRKLQNQTDIAVERKQKRMDGVRQYVYAGVELTERGKQLLEDSGEPFNQEVLKSPGDGGPEEWANQVVRTVDSNTVNKDSIGHGGLVGKLCNSGLEPEQAEKGIEKARQRGDIYENEEGQYRVS